MSSLAFLMQPQLLPFAVALGVVVGLCLLEVAMSLFGLSMIGDAGGADVEMDVDAGPGFEADTDADAEATPGMTGGFQGLLSWLGIGEVPMMVWLAGILTAFGIAGYGLQLGISAAFGGPLPALPAAALALLPGLAGGASVARLLGRLVPKTESTAISTRSYGGRRGVITTGTARRGAPAEARFRDGHGNTHYAMVEPLHDHETFPAGSEVILLRMGEATLRAVRLDDEP